MPTESNTLQPNMFENGCVLRQYADESGEGEYTKYEMKFYDEGQ